MKDLVKADSLITFLNQKNNSDVKFNKESTIERKEVIINKVDTVNEEEGTVWCTISTQDVDRGGDVVLANGINVDEFKKIPSIYKNHNYADDPVGICEELLFKNDCVMAKVKFAPLSVQMVKDTWERVKAGTLRGVSIGFEAKEVIMRGTKSFDEICKSLNMSTDSYQKAHRIISKWTLYEFSICGIPMNPNCMTKQDEQIVEVKQLEVAVEEVKQVEVAIEEVKHEEEATKDGGEVKQETPIASVVDSPKNEETKSINEDLEGNDEIAEEQSEEYKIGMEVEKEHGEDLALRDKITKDHLKEHPDYYSKLATLFKDVEEVQEEVEEEKPVEKHITVIQLPEQPKTLRFMKVLKTPEEVDSYVKKVVKARISGKTTIE